VNLLCPKCSAPIPPADVNVAEGVALCRACSTVSRLADLINAPELAAVDPAATPPPGCWFSSDGAHTVVGCSARSGSGAAAAIGIALFWNGIVSVFVLCALGSTIQHITGSIPAWFPAPPINGQNGQSGIPLGVTIFLWFFLLPFIAIGLALLAAACTCIAGRVEVLIRGDDAQVFIGCGSIGWRRRFPMASVKSVTIGQTTWRQNDQTKPVIVIDCGSPLRFGSSLPPERRVWLGAMLRKLLVVA